MRRSGNVHDFYARWRTYVPAARRKQQAARRALESAAEGETLQPVRLTGRKIATSFWGKAWCDNLERYGDYSNRLPRGRTYVRNGSVIDLRIGPGAIDALVSGSSIYTVRVQIEALPQRQWRALAAECSGHIGSLLDLLQGRFSTPVMQLLARAEDGLFPVPRQIAFSCSCPDWAAMCKHVAAALYGVGSRFDTEPQLFFTLRQVDAEDLLGAAAAAEGLASATAAKEDEALAGADLAGIFGIDLDLEGAHGPEERPAAPVHSGAVGAAGSTKVPARRTKARAKAAPRAKEGRRGDTRRRSGAGGRRATPRARRAADDGLGEVFAPGLEVSAALLVGLGVPETTFRNWLRAGVLQTTRTRSIYRSTAATLARVRNALSRSGWPR